MPRVKQFEETAILNKAMELFWKQGYEATSIRDLVGYLGINRASLYDTFGDKEQLFLKAFNTYRSTNHNTIKAFLNSQDDVKTAFYQLFKMAIDEAVNDKDKKGCFVVNTTTELIPNNSEFTEILSNNMNDFQALFFDALEKGKSRGQLNTDCDTKVLSQFLFTYYSGIRVVTKVKPDKNVLYKSLDLLLTLFN